MHATARQCHQLNPGLEIHTTRRRSLRGAPVGDAMFWCPPAGRGSHALVPALDHPVSFVVVGRVMGQAISISGPGSGAIAVP